MLDQEVVCVFFFQEEALDFFLVLMNFSRSYWSEGIFLFLNERWIYWCSHYSESSLISSIY